jgi:hypothetical protein
MHWHHAELTGSRLLSEERLALIDLLLKASEENPDFDDRAIGGEISLFVAAVKIIIILRHFLVTYY